MGEAGTKKWNEESMITVTYDDFSVPISFVSRANESSALESTMNILLYTYMYI